MTDETTILNLLARGRGGDAALSAPDCAPLTYDRLRRLCADTIDALNGAGVGRGDRVAIVLPNGPVMAAAFVAVSTGATAAPLNPAYTSDEFDFYLSDLKAKALLVMKGSTSPAIEAAADMGVPVIPVIREEGAPAGLFTLEATAAPEPAELAGAATRGDAALILHTSGTTSRPKIVPLSHANLYASADHIRASLNLTSDDRCLNIMPLFHIHGLIAAVLSSLAAGAEIYCTPGFDALKVFRWLDDAKPSWYTAVPTMHQAILARAPRNRDSIERAKLRFVRSSSSSLPPPVMAELEELFHCPVIEAYGMTEAAHQMASNPLPPAQRKPGSVGLAAGPEIAIMDEAGAIMAAGGVGEIVIRGANVTTGYDANPDANSMAYTDGWFRTGDQGRLDEEGYLYITGRLKEIINRGGEKISPREVDDVLSEHPAIAQVVTFAVPDAKLGEDVGAAIVIKEGESLDKQTVKDFAAARLAAFKVPRTILFVDEIPKGATGKLQRIGLHEKLGL